MSTTRFRCVSDRFSSTTARLRTATDRLGNFMRASNVWFAWCYARGLILSAFRCAHRARRYSGDVLLCWCSCLGWVGWSGGLR